MRPAVEEALKTVADDVAQAAKDRVPVRTGRLRDAIHVEEKGEGVYVIAGDNEAWYGHLVEHGTSHSPPEPFLIPVFEENRDRIEADVGAAIRETVR